MSAESGADETDAPSMASVGRTGGRYLLAVHWLSTAGTGRVSTGDLRRSLDVSGASVTEMAAKLQERGLVDYEKYGGVRLTGRGRALASDHARRVCVVTTFFESVLDTELDEETSYDIGFALPREGLHGLRELTDGPCIDACPEGGRDDAGCPS